MNTYGSFMPDFHQGKHGRVGCCHRHVWLCQDPEAQQFLGEIADICEDVQPSMVHVIQCDTRIRQVDTFERGDEFDVGRNRGPWRHRLPARLRLG